jgi:hypothetical protein
MRRILSREERTIRVVNGEEAKVEAIGELPLEISNCFTLYLYDVLYVPSMKRLHTAVALEFPVCTRSGPSSHKLSRTP